MKLERFEDGTIEYQLNGKPHREDGPATEYNEHFLVKNYQKGKMKPKKS
jgi:hypothetical protein